MRTLFNTLILITGAMFFLTGCSTTNGPYTPKYVNGVLKHNLSEVKETVIVKQHAEKIVTKNPESVRGKLGKLALHTSAIGDNVTKDFFEQYFNNVAFGNESQEGLLYVNFEVLDYTYYHGAIADASVVSLDTKITVKKNGKEILNKHYTKTVDSNTYFNVNIFNHTLKTIAVETFHKGVLDIYENQIKPDLLKALKENI